MPLSSPPRRQTRADAWHKRSGGAEPRRCHRPEMSRHGDRGHGQPGHIPSSSSSWRDAGGATTARPPLKMSFCCRELYIAPKPFGGLLLSEVFIAAGELRGWRPRGMGAAGIAPGRAGSDPCLQEGGWHRGEHPAWSPKIIHRGAQPHLQNLSTHPAPSRCLVAVVPWAIRRSPQPFLGDFSPEQNQTQMPKAPQGDSPGETPKSTVLAQKLTPPAAERQDAEPFLLPSAPAALPLWTG